MIAVSFFCCHKGLFKYTKTLSHCVGLLVSTKFDKLTFRSTTIKNSGRISTSSITPSLAFFAMTKQVGTIVLLVGTKALSVGATVLSVGATVLSVGAIDLSVGVIVL
jgi:hypothetical protein